MTVLTVENTSRVRKPVRVFDANGVEIEYCISCNTETGYVVQYKRLDNTFVMIAGEFQTISEFRPAPLRIEPVPVF